MIKMEKTHFILHKKINTKFHLQTINAMKRAASRLVINLLSRTLFKKKPEYSLFTDFIEK